MLGAITGDAIGSVYEFDNTKDYDFVANNEIRASLAMSFGIKSIEDVDLAAAAERYLLRIGVPADDIDALREKLGPDARHPFV